jgi:hypothetical protein
VNYIGIWYSDDDVKVPVLVLVLLLIQLAYNIIYDELLPLVTFIIGLLLLVSSTINVAAVVVASNLSVPVLVQNTDASKYKETKMMTKKFK